MAIRPLITTGAALTSAGLLIASLPAIAPPLLDREIRIAAESQAPAEWFPSGRSAAPVQDFAAGLGLVENAAGPDAPAQLLTDPDVLQTLLDAFFIGYPTSDGPDGFTGVTYFAVDQVFPDSPLVDAFFEGGFTEVARVVLVGLAGGVETPLGGAINDFFEGGVTQLVGNALVDALPDDSYAQGVTYAFFFGYSNEDDDVDPPAGIVGATYYTLTTLISGSPPPIPEEPAPEEPEPEAMQLAVEQRMVRTDGHAAALQSPPAASPPAFDDNRPVWQPAWRTPTTPDPEPPVAPPVAQPVADATPAPQTPPDAAEDDAKPAAVDRTERDDNKPTVDMTTGNKTTVKPVLPFGRRPGGAESGNWIRDAWKDITGRDESPKRPAQSAGSDGE